ncbi:MAG: BrnA antitoxin family protein [Anaerolineales bacterium]
MNEDNLNKPTVTNLDQLDAMTDDMIDTSDIPPLTEEFFATARWRMPQQKIEVTIEVDPEVLEWFKAQGDRYQQYIAAALRVYALAHQLPTE